MKLKHSFTVIALLLATVLVLSVFVGCGNPSVEKDNPSMVSYDMDILKGPLYSSYGATRIELKLNENVQFECHTNGEPYYLCRGSLQDYLVEVTINSGETIGLYAREHDTNSDTKVGFMTIIAREKDNIVGYIILKLLPQSENGSIFCWKIEKIKSVEFPQVDGQYQNVSEAYVQRQFRKYTK